MKKGEPVKIPGLGILRLRKMKARMGDGTRRPERRSRFRRGKKVGFTVVKDFKDGVLGRTIKKEHRKLTGPVSPA